MKKLFSILILVSLLFVGLQVSADDEATVSATVTAQNISVTVSDGSVAYGTLALGASKSTIAAELNDSQTVTNNGNVTEDFDIKGSNSTGDVWAIVDADPTEDDYMHAFSINAGSDWTYMSEEYKALDTNKAALATTTLDLKITTPTSTATFTEQTVSVTILATAS